MSPTVKLVCRVAGSPLLRPQIRGKRYMKVAQAEPINWPCYETQLIKICRLAGETPSCVEPGDIAWAGSAIAYLLAVLGRMEYRHFYSKLSLARNSTNE